MASQWPSRELTSGVNSKLPFCTGHVLQRAIAFYFLIWKLVYWGKGDLEGCSPCFFCPSPLLASLSPKCFFPLSWCDCIGHHLSAAGSKVTSHQSRDGTAVALCILGTFAVRQMLRLETGFSVCVSSLISPACANLWRGRVEKGSTREQWWWCVESRASCSQVPLRCVIPCWGSANVQPAAVRRLLPKWMLMSERDHVE